MFEQMIRFFQVGGWSMAGIALCSVLALAVFFERLWALRRRGVIPTGLGVEVEDSVRQGKTAEAITLCKKLDSPLSRILRGSLENAGKTRERIKEIVLEVGRREATGLERYLSVLNTIVVVAPMLGFLGTVLGMLQLFSSVAAAGEVTNIGMIADGIYKALYTTIAGLTVAIPAMVAARYLDSTINRLVLQMEEISLKVVDLIKQA